MVTNEAQAESVIYGDLGAVSGTQNFSVYHLHFVAVLMLFAVFCSASIWSIYYSFIHCFSWIFEPARASSDKYVTLYVACLLLLFYAECTL
jgi:hypothetical protein